jgi:hypothetical protein
LVWERADVTDATFSPSAVVMELDVTHPDAPGNWTESGALPLAEGFTAGAAAYRPPLASEQPSVVVAGGTLPDTVFGLDF